jgi:hypothetical protein
VTIIVSGVRFYRHSNADIINAMIDHYKIVRDRYENPASILGFRVDRQNRTMRNDDGREWEIPADWPLT